MEDFFQDQKTPLTDYFRNMCIKFFTLCEEKRAAYPDKFSYTVEDFGIVEDTSFCNDGSRMLK